MDRRVPSHDNDCVFVWKIYVSVFRQMEYQKIVISLQFRLQNGHYIAPSCCTSCAVQETTTQYFAAEKEDAGRGNRKSKNN